MPVNAQGWYRDPYGIHEDRYFSAGEPTKLVRDSGAESYDPPPPYPPQTELVQVTRSMPTDSEDTRRARHGGGGMSRRHAAPKRPARIGPRFAAWWRRLTGSAAATTVAFGLLILACTFIAVAGPRASAELRTDAFRQLVAKTAPVNKTVVGTDEVATLSAAMNARILSVGQIEEAGTKLGQSLAKTLPIGPASGYWNGLTTPFSSAAQVPNKPGVPGTEFEFAYRSRLSQYVRVIAGSLPVKVSFGRNAATVDVAVTKATAERFGFSVGSQVAVTAGLTLKVTGIVAPRDAAAPFWTVDQIAAAPVLVQPSNAAPYWQAGVFAPAAAIGPLQGIFSPVTTQLTWVYPLALGRLTGTQAISLSHSLPGTLSTAGQLTFSAFQNIAGFELYSGAGSLLSEFTSQAAAVTSLLDLLSVSLAIVGAAVVLLTAWLMAEQRREEFAMLRARGASRRNLGVAALTASAIAAVPAAVVGAALAVLLTPGGGAQLAWWLGVLTVLTALAGPAIITIRVHRSYTAATSGLTGRPDRPVSRMQAIRRLVAESALTLLCIGALIVLRRQTASSQSDLVASAAPALAAVPVAIIMLRLYPAALRPMLRVAARRGGVVSFLGLARAARVAATAVLPAFAMVLALSLVSFAGMVRAAIVRGEVAQSWRAVGADAVVTVAPATMSAAQQRSVTAVPGVQGTAPVAVTVASRGFTGNPLTVLITNPAQYAGVLAHSPAGPPPASFTDWRAGAASRPGSAIPVLASPGLAALHVGKTGFIEVAYRRYKVQIVGTGPAMSSLQEIVNSSVGGYLVLPASAVGADAPAPDTMLVAGTSLDGHELASLVISWHQGGAVTLRSTVLAGLKQSPVPRDAYAELLFGGIAGAIGCLLVLLLVLLLSARSREVTLARTATLGLSPAQGRWLTLVEALPQLLAVLLGGAICAIGLAPLVGPALDLAVFTGSATSVPVRIDPVWLGATAIGLLVLAIATLSVQTMLADREAPRSLRIGG